MKAISTQAALEATALTFALTNPGPWRDVPRLFKPYSLTGPIGRPKRNAAKRKMQKASRKRNRR